MARSLRTPRRALLLSLGALVAVMAAAIASLAPYGAGDERTLTELTAAIDARSLQAMTVLDQDNRIVTLDGGRRYWTSHPDGDGTATRLIQAAAAAGVPVRVDAQTTKAVTRLLVTTLLPLLVLANVFALLFVGSRGGSAIGEVAGFGRLRRGAAPASTTTFADVAGLPEAVEELQEVVDYLKRPERYDAVGAVPPKGVILFGPPGCGKTLLARAVAGEAGVAFFSVAGAEFVEALVGVGAARVRDLFNRVRAAAPAIVFIDELDAAGRRRTSGGGGSDERDQTLNQLLVEMDGFDIAAGVVVMAATNRVDIIDPALLRPGRFDRHITVDLPDLSRRRAILALHGSGKPLGPDADLDRVAELTPGFAGADLASVINEATLLAIRRGAASIDQRLLTEAVDRVRSGPGKHNHDLGADDEHRLAVREAGRIVALRATGSADTIERASLFAPTRASRILDTADHAVLSEQDMRDRLLRAVAPGVAEVLVFGSRSTAGEADLAAATRLATAMAGRYGMSDRRFLRHVIVDGPGTEFLGGGGFVDYLAPRTHAAFDVAVERLLVGACERAAAVVEADRQVFDRLVDGLLELETLEGRDLSVALADPGPQVAARPSPAVATT